MRVGRNRRRWVRVIARLLWRRAGVAMVLSVFAYGLGSLAAQYPVPVGD